MKITKTICDYCGEECRGDYITAYRNTPEGSVVGKGEYCDICWNRVREAFRRPVEVKNDN